ncbi:Response regulator receiver domain-containing protein [Robiginitalea myxolifaciens]|uniref:Response regulator receiver domain-containing protein n=1 Tax=Robiginitalea myxolifaciens TaxID=400055 RepID=A0A1I6GWG8_9FLAO|nr:response regulator [Robiginitalea myxolifaciens]SFR46542.1 Response regulator receiver domain-containing protein [Robiginitalea myxolifaciens]
MKNFGILWVDDEIDLLKSHLLFLEERNYVVTTCNSGQDALEEIRNNTFDIVFLDENMPGLSGLETLTELKQIEPSIPVVMITKNEEESIMEEAIGSKIADYLIKPVNPNQILLCLKKNLDHSRLVSEKTTANYQQEFRKIAMDLSMVNSYEEWAELYRKLIFWELQLESIEDSSMFEILESQKSEANQQFGKFIEKHYADWFSDADAPVMSHTLFREWVQPVIAEGPTLLVVIDNLRYDQWFTIEDTIAPHYRKVKEQPYFSILPTATQYARNAMFSGLMPADMEKRHPEWWKNDTDEGGKNLHERDFLGAQLKRLGLDLDWDYHKISSLKQGRHLSQQFNSLKSKDLIAVVYNFVDMLSHARTEMEVIKELASNDKAYRSLTHSWFRNSPLLDLIQAAQTAGFQLIITTDHGTINVKQPSKVIGDRDTSLNLRYKTGRSLTYEDKDVLAAKDPTALRLPKINMSSSFIFAKNDLFFAYPNNYNHYVSYYRNTYQHGGVSLEEMIVPFIWMKPK